MFPCPGTILWPGKSSPTRTQVLGDDAPHPAHGARGMSRGSLPAPCPENNSPRPDYFSERLKGWGG
ncbi:hypothetical protein P7K49_034081, partial [Saguinus oedipus]